MEPNQSPEAEDLETPREGAEGITETERAALEELKDLLPRLPAPKAMSHAQKDLEKKMLRERLKALNAVPRSNWHRGFEDILQIDVASWKNDAHIDREISIGEEAPRADFLVINSNRLPDAAKSIFRHFLVNNLVEYKRPDEIITERMVWKTGGYGNLLIGTTKETQYRIGEVTLTLFGSRMRSEDCSRMKQAGILSETGARGVYSVKQITPLPFQLVITDALEGDEYAAYRALSDHAKAQDVGRLLIALKEEKGEIRERYHRILNLIEQKNPGTVADMIREDRKMKSVFLDVLKPEIEEIVAQRTQEVRREAYNQGYDQAYGQAFNQGFDQGVDQGFDQAYDQAYNQVVENLICGGYDGKAIATATGYDRGHIDSIAQRLNRSVNWAK